MASILRAEGRRCLCGPVFGATIQESRRTRCTVTFSTIGDIQDLRTGPYMGWSILTPRLGCTTMFCKWQQALWIILAGFPACQRGGSPEAIATSSQAVAASATAVGSAPTINPLPIGASCSGADGWQRDPWPVTPGVEQLKQGPVAVSMVGIAHKERDQLSPGITFCLTPSVYYPHGYMTANCAKDTDCPNGAVCDGELCRAPCSSDSQCQSPATCVASGSVRYCCQTSRDVNLL